ncbi:MAG TPA: helix-turn-helix domain-containing protein [Chroococcales cyanobacterium]
MSKKQYFCPTELALDVLAGKWKSAILWVLSYGPQRFSELHSIMKGVPRQSLSDRLHELERDGLINKTLYQDNPVRYKYALTNEGLELWGITKQLCEWGQRQRPNQVFPSAECVQQLHTKDKKEKEKKKQ